MKRPLKYSLLTAALLLLPLALYGLDDWSFDITDHGSFGVSNYLVNQSLGVGYNNLAYAPYSKNAVIGLSLQNYQSYNLTVGQYNTSVTGDLFTVGNGSTDTARANSLSVSESGVHIPGTAEITAVSAQGGIANFTGTAPAWWSSAEYGFLTSSAGNNNSPANIGQLKHVASRAKLYLDFHLAKVGGAGSAIKSMCTFSNSDNFAPVAVGQLKNVANLFYTRLNQFDSPARPLPWNETNHSQNAAPITIGQLKSAFAFQFSAAFLTQNANAGYVIPSWWISHFGLVSMDPSVDTDLDGISNPHEYLMGTHPTEADPDGDYANDKEETSEGFDPWSDQSAPTRLCYVYDRIGRAIGGNFKLGWSVLPGSYYEEDWKMVDALGEHSVFGGSGHVDGVLNFATQLFPPPTTEITKWNKPQLSANDLIGSTFVQVSSWGEDHYHTDSVVVWLRGPKTTGSISRSYLKRVAHTMRNDVGADIPVPEDLPEFLTFNIPPGSNNSTPQTFKLLQSTSHGPAPVVIPLPKQDYSEEVKASVHEAVRSKDRYLSGIIDTAPGINQTDEVEFIGLGSENPGTYKFDGSSGTFIYDTEDQMFSNSELDGVLSGSIGANSKQLNQQVVFWRESSGSPKIKFSTVVGSLGNVVIRFKKNGVIIQTLTHTLTADPDFGKLLVTLGKRLKSLNMPSVAPFRMLPEINGIEDGSPAIFAVTIQSNPTAVAGPTLDAINEWRRNMLAKLAYAADTAIEKVKSAANTALKVSGGYIEGYIDGLWDGLKSDADAVNALGMMGLESLQGDFTRASAMWDSLKWLASLDKAGRAALFDQMMEKFVDKAQVAEPWNPAGTGVDDEGIAAYMYGYTAGFMTEQVIMTMAVAGIITKAGQSVRIAFEASEIAKITAVMVSGVRKFTTGAFLSVSKYVGPLGTNAIRAVRASIDEVARWTRTNGITNGEIIASLMERLGPAKLTYQEIGYYLSKVCKTHDDWVKIGTPAFPVLAGLSDSLGILLTEKGVRGFLNLWKGALRDGSNGHYMASFYIVMRHVGGALDAQGMAKILEMFDDVATAGYKFTPDPTDPVKWTSMGGIVYERGGAEGHRICHVLAHTVTGFKAPPHSVFNVARHSLFELLDEAWTKPHLVAYKIDGVTPDPTAFIVDMGRTIGTANERFIRFAFKGNRASKRIIAAYPVN